MIVLLLNWKRPANLRDRILPSLLADSCVTRIIVAHGNPETVFGVDSLAEGQQIEIGKVLHIGDYDANEPFRSFRRWLLIQKLHVSGVLPDGYIHVQDDDLLFQKGHLEALRSAYEAGKGRLISGSFGRILRNGLYTTTPIEGPCDLVVGQSIFTRVKTIADAVRTDIPLSVLREDDLTLSFLTNPDGVPLPHFAMRCARHLLPSPDALSDQPGHREARNAAVAYMRLHGPAFVSVGAVFKQEAHALREWIEHYLWLGVDHIYLINDGSTDDYLSQIEPYKTRVTLIENKVTFERFGRQGRIYDAYLKKIPSEWLLLVDLDEFLYSPTGLDLRSFLRTCTANQILVPWHIFGSNGCVEQPASLLCGFTKRVGAEDTCRINPTPYKAFVRVKSLIACSVHSHSCQGVPLTLPFEGDFVLNHYMLQSRRFYIDIKCTRGSANHFELCSSAAAVVAQTKTQERFDFIDSFATVVDTRLSNARSR